MFGVIVGVKIAQPWKGPANPGDRAVVALLIVCYVWLAWRCLTARVVVARSEVIVRDITHTRRFQATDIAEVEIVSFLATPWLALHLQTGEWVHPAAFGGLRFDIGNRQLDRLRQVLRERLEAAGQKPAPNVPD
jgi:hypothetical protein